MFNRIRELREFEDYSMLQIANKLGVSKGTYAMWEYGKDVIPLTRLIQLSNIYRVHLDYLMNLGNTIKSKQIYQIDSSLIAANLKRLRKKLNLSQKDIATSINISRNSWDRYENNHGLITTIPLYELCKKYLISAEDILFNKQS